MLRSDLKFIFGINIALLLFSACDKGEQPSLSILPSPKLLIEGEGMFSLDKETSLYAPDSLLYAAELLQHYLLENSGLIVPLAEEKRNNQIILQPSNVGNAEYHIRSESDLVILEGGGREGILLGIQTLRQLLMLNGNEGIPALELSDSPRFPWRGMLLDCSRHFMEVDFVKRYIDLLALYKMNVLHWHLTEDQGWRIEIDQYPRLTEIGAWRDDGAGGTYGGYYTKEDVRGVVAYAEERGILVVPEIELPGHSQAALAAYPQFSCTGGPFEVETEWGVFKEIYCAGNDSTFLFLENVLDEVTDLFPSPYIHIGGDEVPKYRWEHCAKCQLRIEEEGLVDEHELQSYFIGRIGKYLASKGKRMIGWDEILEGGLPDGAIVQSWRGFEGAKKAVQSGTQTIVSPTSHAYFDYGLNDIDLAKVHSFDPVPEGLTKDQEQQVLGGECNMWTERAPQDKVDQKVFPRMIAMSEVLWNGNSQPDFETFRKHLARHYPMLDSLGVNYGFETVPVKISTVTRDQSLYVRLSSYDSAVDIYYQDEKANQLYVGPDAISNETNWTITFRKGGSVFKDTIFQHFLPHLANGIIPQIGSEANANYTAGGQRAITDGKKGSTHFRDGNWQGYWGDDIIAVIDFGEEQSISSFSAGFLQYNNAWIFLPTEVNFSVSADGKEFTEVGRVSNPISPREKEQLTHDFKVELSQPLGARFIQMKAKNMGVCPDWHDAAGSKAWLFIDEFAVE